MNLIILVQGCLQKYLNFDFNIFIILPLLTCSCRKWPFFLYYGYYRNSVINISTFLEIWCLQKIHKEIHQGAEDQDNGSALLALQDAGFSNFCLGRREIVLQKRYQNLNEVKLYCFDGVLKPISF